MRRITALLGAALLASCSTPTPSSPPVGPTISHDPIAVPTDGPRSPSTVLEALWERERQVAERDERIAELEAEVRQLRAALDSARRPE